MLGGQTVIDSSHKKLTFFNDRNEIILSGYLFIQEENGYITELVLAAIAGKLLWPCHYKISKLN